MKNKWRVARVTKCEVASSSAAHTDYVQVRFYLLEPYKLGGHKVRGVVMALSVAPKGVWRAKQFLDSIEAPELDHLPASVLLGRYCKLLLNEETYEDKVHLRVTGLRPLNPHIQTKAEIEAEKAAAKEEEQYRRENPEEYEQDD
jgi:hypothetical protein